MGKLFLSKFLAPSSVSCVACTFATGVISKKHKEHFSTWYFVSAELQTEPQKSTGREVFLDPVFQK